MVTIQKYEATQEGMYLFELNKVRRQLVSKLSELECIEPEDFAMMFKKNSSVARFVLLHEEKRDFFEAARILGSDDNVDQYKYLYAHSQISEEDHKLLKFMNFEIIQQQTNFKTLVLDRSGEEGKVWDRKVDTEAKIFESIYKDIYQNMNGYLYVGIYTRYKPCKSCEWVMEQFIDKLKEQSVEVRINVYYAEGSSKKSKNRLRKEQEVL
ncbi:hypothetical protein BK124_00600 [Paenibacillus amylolyticus]|uniref:deaminase domain-containing protein n=1 Tax=Paenibacillus amylolyticus TaxID=1451 RepID=UPI00096FF867|nr:deaminase domain-containing protein [Paenibacillus amylolyticus]OMF01211.1 hypothetical protein BK124_00600 [Paenibacillus amylolyticus]